MKGASVGYLILVLACSCLGFATPLPQQPKGHVGETINQEMNEELNEHVYYWDKLSHIGWFIHELFSKMKSKFEVERLPYEMVTKIPLTKKPIVVLKPMVVLKPIQLLPFYKHER